MPDEDLKKVDWLVHTAVRMKDWQFTRKKLIIIHFLKKEGIEDKKCYKIAIEGTLTKLKC